LFHEKQSSSKSILEQWLDYPIKELNGIELDSVTSMKKVLEYGQTVAFISELLIQEELTSQTLASRKLADLGLTRTIYLVKNKSFFDDAISLNFKELLGNIVVTPQLSPSIKQKKLLIYKQKNSLDNFIPREC
jgi:DNA-binding transcriptional LysR family regulator